MHARHANGGILAKNSALHVIMTSQILHSTSEAFGGIQFHCYYMTIPRSVEMAFFQAIALTVAGFIHLIQKSDHVTTSISWHCLGTDGHSL